MSMRAAIWTRYGAPEALQLQQVDMPTVGKNEILVKVHASTVTAGDVRLRALNVPPGFWLPTRLAFGILKPRKRIIGMDISGEVMAVGSRVTQFREGDQVFGTTGMRLGANADYVCLPENAILTRKPSNVSHREAVACVFGGLTAIHYVIDQANLSQGQKILINGASGAVGTAAVQLAAHIGAEVTGVCSTSNIALVESLGAQQVIDYSKGEVTQSQGQYDVILDAVGNLSLQNCGHLMAQDGKLMLINTDLFTNLMSLFKENMICGVAAESKSNLDALRRHIESEAIQAIIDKIYPLEEIVDAHRYVEMGRKKGSVVIVN